MKNLLISIAAVGVSRTPGVIEVSLGIIPVTTAASILFLSSEMLPELVVFLGSLLPFVTIHEENHNYSGGIDYYGFIPVKLIRRKVTPGKAKFEGE